VQRFTGRGNIRQGDRTTLVRLGMSVTEGTGQVGNTFVKSDSVPQGRLQVAQDEILGKGPGKDRDPQGRLKPSSAFAWISRPYGTARMALLYPGFHPGLLAAVPAGLNRF
jgi:hypothetical protein